MSNEQNTPEEPQETAPAAPQPYRESEDHVPDPTAITGTLETSGTGGGRHARLEGVAAIFSGMTQQTVERDGLAEHQGALVQTDTTGVPETFTGPAEGEQEPEAELSPEAAEEVAKEAEVSSEEAPATEDAKPVAKKTAARKTAAADPKK